MLIINENLIIKEELEKVIDIKNEQIKQVSKEKNDLNIEYNDIKEKLKLNETKNKQQQNELTNNENKMQNIINQHQNAIQLYDSEINHLKLQIQQKKIQLQHANAFLESLENKKTQLEFKLHSTIVQHKDKLKEYETKIIEKDQKNNEFIMSMNESRNIIQRLKNQHIYDESEIKLVEGRYRKLYRLYVANLNELNITRNI